MYHSPLTLIIPSFIPFEHEFLCTQFHANKCAIRPGFTPAFPPIIGFKHNHWHLYASIIGWSGTKKFWYPSIWGSGPIEPTHVGRLVDRRTKPWQVVDIWDCQPTEQPSKAKLGWGLGGGTQIVQVVAPLYLLVMCISSFPTRLIVVQTNNKIK